MNNIKNKINYVKKFIYIYTYEIIANKGSIISDIVVGISLPVIIQLISWNYIYSNNQTIHNYSFLQMSIYIITTVTLFGINNGNEIIRETSERIKTGSIDLYNIKPLSYFHLSFFTTIGRDFFIILFVYLVLITSCILNNNFNYIIPVLFFLFLSQYISFQISYICSLANYWFVKDNLITFMYFTSSQILGGILLPVEFWPEPFQTILKYNPFRVTISGIPDLILHPNKESLVKFIFLLLFYGLLFHLIIQFLTKKSTKIYTSYGG